MPKPYDEHSSSPAQRTGGTMTGSGRLTVTVSGRVNKAKSIDDETPQRREHCRDARHLVSRMTIALKSIYSPSAQFGKITI